MLLKDRRVPLAGQTQQIAHLIFEDISSFAGGRGSLGHEGSYRRHEVMHNGEWGGFDPACVICDTQHNKGVPCQ